MNLATLLQQWVQQQPTTPAIVDLRYRETLSFAELEQRSAQAAALLHQVGLKPGDAVLIFQPMSAQLYVALLAIFRLGLIAMFVDPSAGKDHLDRCCELYPPQALIASAKAHLLRLRSPALERIPHKFATGFPVPGAIAWQQLRSQSADPNIVGCPPDTPALLTFTSGSTGQPKAALRSHGFLWAQHRALATSLQLTPGQTDLTTLPIFLLANLASGVTSLIADVDLRAPGKVDPAKLWAAIQRYQPHTTAASPALLSRLGQFAQQQNLRLSSFQRLYSGGAPVLPNLLDQLQRCAPQAQVSAVYGSTEAEPIAHIARDRIQPADQTAMLRGQGLLVGEPVPEIDLRILSDRWGEPLKPMTRDTFTAACLPPGTVGEIVVSGEHVLPGYLHGQGNAETKFWVDGTVWHRTGDAGYLDATGRLWLLGRCSARIQDAHGTIYPFAVEVAAQQHPGVRRAAIASHRQQRVLVVELASNDAAILTSLRSQLAWAAVDRLLLCSQIPVDRRHNAKIDYPALQRWLQQHEAASRLMIEA